jgi:hypothetical protein
MTKIDAPYSGFVIFYDPTPFARVIQLLVAVYDRCGEARTRIAIHAQGA